MKETEGGEWETETETDMEKENKKEVEWLIDKKKKWGDCLKEWTERGSEK